jgi:hypothetical protein
MSRLAATLSCIILSLFLSGAAAADQTPLRAQVLLVGTFHMYAEEGAEAGALVPDLMQPHRQREIEDVVARLARFRPTVIAVEALVENQNRLDENYRRYQRGRYSLIRHEIDQIGFRLARGAGLGRLHAVDVSLPASGDSPVDDPATLTPRRAAQQLERRQARIQAAAQAAHAPGRSMLDIMRWHNGPAAAEQHAIYADIATIRHNGEPRGAENAARWHRRNLLIYANIAALAETGQERILVLYGSGHIRPLSDLFEASELFELVPVSNYLD